MLNGIAEITATASFVPAQLETMPAFFATADVEDDELSIARQAARAAFTWPGDELVSTVTPLTEAQQALMAKGEIFYNHCAICHGPTGTGIEGLAPTLVDTQWVLDSEQQLGRIILQGLSGPIDVNGVTWNSVMPPHGHLETLDDETLAGLMTYLRRSWGNKADPVSVESAAAIRAATAERTFPWTVLELEQMSFSESGQ